MKKFFSLLTMALLFSALFIACEKESVTPNDDAVGFRSDCCVDAYSDTHYNLAGDYHLTVYNDEVDIFYSLTRSSGNFPNNVWFSTGSVEDLDNDDYKVMSGGSAVNGSSYDGDVLTWSAPIPEGWDGCPASITIYLKTAGGGSGSNQTFTLTYYPQELCTACEWRGETAFGGASAGEGNAWWFYFDTQGDATQAIYAGQVETDGSVTWDGTNLIIDLGSWSLQDDDEAVKVMGYDEVPSSRPAAGASNDNRFYAGTGLTIEGNGSRYYVIHLDVEICE